MRKSLLTLLVLLVLQTAVLILASVFAHADSRQQIFLPTVRNAGLPPVFGIEMARLNAERGIDLVTSSGTVWVRRNALPWKHIEPERGGGYRWDHPYVQELEQEIIRASQLGINLVLVVHGNPAWAVTPYSADCAPINPQHYGDFARFMAAAVERYSRPPFNLKYWEIANEPDAPINTTDNVFGCWGVEGDPYFGGRAFGEMLKIVVPAMKAVNREIIVLNGGLLLDAPFVEGKSKDTSGRFFEGMLVAGAGPLIDIISFHTYIFHQTPGQAPLGPPEDWRVAYLRGMLRRYNLPERPMIRTETALLCVVITPECRWAQADLIGRTYARTVRDGLLATIWYIYDQDGFHNTALIEPYDVWVPRPAYFAYRHTARMLSAASYVGPIAGLPASAEGYGFTRGNQTVYIYWTDSSAEVPFAIPVPAGARVTCTDRDGGPVRCEPDGATLTVRAQTSPAFVVVTP